MRTFMKSTWAVIWVVTSYPVRKETEMKIDLYFYLIRDINFSPLENDTLYRQFDDGGGNHT